MFGYAPTVDAWEIERLRRSIAMLPEGHSSAGPLTKEAARALIDELVSAKEETARYREVVAQLRQIIGAL
jgi:hypothetical protein